MKVHKTAVKAFVFYLNTVAADKITKSKNIPFQASRHLVFGLQIPKTSSPF